VNKNQIVEEITKRMAEAHRISSEIDALSIEQGALDSRRETWEDAPGSSEHKRNDEIETRLKELYAERDHHLSTVERLNAGK